MRKDKKIIKLRVKKIFVMSIDEAYAYDGYTGWEPNIITVKVIDEAYAEVTIYDNGVKYDNMLEYFKMLKNQNMLDENSIEGKDILQDLESGDYRFKELNEHIAEEVSEVLLDEDDDFYEPDDSHRKDEDHYDIWHGR